MHLLLRLVIDDKVIPAHRNILYVRCEHFRAMFSHNMKETALGKVDIKDVTYEVFQLILEWIYTSRVAITTDNAVELLVASDKVRSLVLLSPAPHFNSKIGS